MADGPGGGVGGAGGSVASLVLLGWLSSVLCPALSVTSSRVSFRSFCSCLCSSCCGSGGGGGGGISWRLFPGDAIKED